MSRLLRSSILLVAVLALCTAGASCTYEAKGFIRVCNGRFADENGKSWNFAGWNGFSNLLNNAFDHLYNGQPDRVDQKFKIAKATGLTAVRMWAHGDGSTSVLQPAQGQYDERVFRSLDYVVHKARQYNIRLLLSFTTYWQDGDGILAYAKWAGLTYPIKDSNSPYYTEQWAAKDKFWTNSAAKKYYKQHVNKIINRRNTFSGIQYKNDWTIFGYDIFNEPRCPASQLSTPCAGRITNWANEMYQYFKSINKKQLVTFGQEGFFAKDGYYGKQPGGSKWWDGCNPYGTPSNVAAGWASRVGQDFPSQHKYADFMEMHLWPINWNTPAASFASKWVQCHINICNRLGKPCIVGEYGFALGSDEGNAAAISRLRNPYIRAVQSTVEHKVKNYANIGGDMFWQWLDEDKKASVSNQNGISTRDSTFKLIKSHAKWMKGHSGKQVCKAIK